MALFSLIFALSCGILTLLSSGSSAAPADNPELFLTPLIKSGDLDKAREAAVDNMKISKIKSEKEVKSFSGFLTIDPAKNANLFFWFFPAQENPEKAPVILWINDIPGYTCLKGVFLETGPFYVDEANQLKERNNSWTRTHSMLYIDSPVGSGFSFADSEDAYANNSEDEANQLHEGLQQFFTLFKEYQGNDFYLAGEVYAGTFMPYIAKKIDSENGKAPVKINLKGLIMGAPYLDFKQTGKEDFYYSLGIINAKQRKEFKDANAKFLDLHNQGKDDEALAYGVTVHLGPTSLTAKLTGFVDTHSALTSQSPPQIGYFTNFIDSQEVHNYLHTGLHKFISTNQVVFKHFSKDIFRTHTKPLEELLDSGYRVLVYTGQFDILITPDTVQEIIMNLKWKKSSEFMDAPRKVWKVGKEVAGYTQNAGNLVFALVRNAGNYAIMDQPDWTTDLVEKFIAGKEL